MTTERGGIAAPLCFQADIKTLPHLSKVKA